MGPEDGTEIKVVSQATVTSLATRRHKRLSDDDERLGAERQPALRDGDVERLREEREDLRRSGTVSPTYRAYMLSNTRHMGPGTYLEA